MNAHNIQATYDLLMPYDKGLDGKAAPALIDVGESTIAIGKGANDHLKVNSESSLATTLLALQKGHKLPVAIAVCENAPPFMNEEWFWQTRKLDLNEGTARKNHVINITGIEQVKDKKGNPILDGQGKPTYNIYYDNQKMHWLDHNKSDGEKPVPLKEMFHAASDHGPKSSQLLYESTKKQFVDVLNQCAQLTLQDKQEVLQAMQKLEQEQSSKMPALTRELWWQDASRDS